MARYKKGQKGYWAGKKKPSPSIETREKIRRSLMGHSISEKTRKILAEVSPFKKGFTPWNKDKPWSEEMKKRISETLKRKGIEPKIKSILYGKNHPNWKGGITPFYLKIRGSLEYKIWRRAVFERDNYTCIWCGDNRGGNLEADHIKPFALFPELRFALDNGRTLCKLCHRTTETWGAKTRT